MLAIAPVYQGRIGIPSPFCTQLMLELLDLKPSDKVLEIGTGSGRQTAIWAESGAEVHSIDLEPWVDSTQILGDCVYLHSGDGAKGLPDHAPFTAIVATCGVTEPPSAWVEQLTEGGRLVCPIGDSTSQRLLVLRRQGSELIPERVAAYVRFQMMKQKPQPRPLKYNPHGEN